MNIPDFFLFLVAFFLAFLLIPYAGRKFFEWMSSRRFSWLDRLSFRGRWFK